MILAFRPLLAQPPDWKPANAGRPTSPFSATYSDTLVVLDRELHAIHATNPTLQVVTAGRNCRADGQLRADARVDHPGVILSFDTKRYGTLTYPCDRYEAGWHSRVGASWQHNLRAIALGLEALRKVERYGIAERGQQYAGYRELGSGIALGAAMTIEAAAAFIAEHAYGPDIDPQEVLDDLEAAYRAAAKALHPDTGGDPDLFRRLTQARDVIEASQ